MGSRYNSDKKLESLELTTGKRLTIGNKKTLKNERFK